jgi:tryptophan halogenase
LALGLASGFLEPLESTAIHLIYKTLIHFISHFPDLDFEPYTELTFNKKIGADYEEIRDFIILHYCITARDDTEFWRWCQNMPVPDSLHDKIVLFRERGQIEHISGEFFTSDSWLSVLDGMKIRPKKYHPLMDAFNSMGLARSLQEGAENIRKTVAQMPEHSDYIQQFSAAKNRM